MSLIFMPNQLVLENVFEKILNSNIHISKFE